MKTKNLIISVILLSHGSCFSLTSDSPEKTLSEPPPMTLRDCLIYARDNAHSNRIYNKEVEKAELDAKLTASRLMPYLGLSADGNLSFGRNIDPETNTYDNKQTLSTGFGLQMSVPLFDGLVSINNLKSAMVARQRIRKGAIAEQDRISIEVIRAFYEVSYCKAMVTQMEEQLARDSNDLKATEQKEALGTKSGADVAEIRAIVANDEYELLNRKNLLKKAYINLRSKMGMELNDSPLNLVETDEETVVTENTADIHPKVAEARLSCKEMKYRLRAAKGKYSPTISLSGGVSTSYFKMIGSNYPAPSFRSQWRDNMGEYVGLSVSIPLFDGFSTVNSVKLAKANLRESEIKLEQAVYELQKETIEAELDYRSACEEHIAAQLQVEAEEIAYKAVRRKYELGISSTIDLYTTAAKLSAAKANLEDKRIKKIVSLITLNYCKSGKLISEL